MNYVAAEGARPASGTAVPASAAESKSINDWLMRMHEASKKQSYIGTFVVSSGGAMSSAKIWHVCEAGQQMERVETLTGAPRSIFRHNDQVVTFMPDHKVVRSEKRESLGMFPELLQSTDGRIADFYKVRPEGVERVAGVEADIIALMPKDNMRFGYRVWTEQKRGLVVKLQTLDVDGKVLEQAAFSELQLDAPVKMDTLIQMMGKVEGYRVEKPVLVKTTASAEGWLLKAPVPGFKAMSCYKRPAAANAVAGEEPLQWIFSDGLASVSIFVEPYDRQRHDKASSLSLGATQTITRQLDSYWITVMGEVPMATLQLFANGLEHKK
ncbi:MucB/RseB C-terminal domain-containing protein [Polaromonas jejuensis]|uniref:MucB/RseB C-terminal domain-containing protein n=1 Tax=Polaromonas jejuensis TaxID=457502 RepID=A0ABW0QIV5_9BURK|nr:MucB/RseB C-terminal domain-containing protein [Polaromonas jejuensis]